MSLHQLAPILALAPRGRRKSNGFGMARDLEVLDNHMMFLPTLRMQQGLLRKNLCDKTLPIRLAQTVMAGLLVQRKRDGVAKGDYGKEKLGIVNATPNPKAGRDQTVWAIPKAKSRAI